MGKQRRKDYLCFLSPFCDHCGKSSSPNIDNYSFAGFISTAGTSLSCTRLLNAGTSLAITCFSFSNCTLIHPVGLVIYCDDFEISATGKDLKAKLVIPRNQ